MTDVINEEIFEYFNTDANLLLINVLLEGFYRGENVFTLNQFIKGQNWKIEAIIKEISDTNDYSSPDELVIHQLIKIIEDLKIGTIKRISVNNVSGVLGKIVKEAVLKKDSTEEDVWYYQAVFNEIFGLEKYRDKNIETIMGKDKPFDSSLLKKIDFTTDNFSKYLQILLSAIPEFVEIEVDYNDEYAKIAHKILDDYIDSFSQEIYIDKKPDYQVKRSYFSNQLENFYSYVKTIPEIKGYINIPFLTLNDTNFEVVKILCYLEREKMLRVNYWGLLTIYTTKNLKNTPKSRIR
ncbi:MAG: hypothetical protein EOM88_03875 [Clostridia bacterium]|nr:hypothetical protein [Clostridia bacterium]